MTMTRDLGFKLLDDGLYGNDTMQIVSNAEIKGKPNLHQETRWILFFHVNRQSRHESS